MATKRVKATGDEVMEEPERITVGLYGGKPLFGGKEAPLRAEETLCSLRDSASACPFRKNGLCLCVTDGFKYISCPYGSIHSHKGYTSRARKYGEFRRKWQNDPVYAKLRQPSRDTFTVARIGAFVALEVPYATIEYDPDRDTPARPMFGNWRCGKGGEESGPVFVSDRANISFGTERVWLPAEVVDASMFVALCSVRPRRLMDDSIISDYKEKVVPAIVADLKATWPEMWEAVVAELPDLAETERDHVGRTARLLTLKDGIAIYDGSGNTFTLDIEARELRCDKYKNALILGLGSARAKGDATLVMKVEENDTIEVADNDWVIPGRTLFV